MENAVADDPKAHYFSVPCRHGFDIIYGDRNMVDCAGKCLHLDVSGEADRAEAWRRYSYKLLLIALTQEIFIAPGLIIAIPSVELP